MAMRPSKRFKVNKKAPKSAITRITGPSLAHLPQLHARQFTLDAGCRRAKRQTSGLQTQCAGIVGDVESHPARHWPALIRGDRDATLKGIKGTEANIAAEQTGIAYL